MFSSGYKTFGMGNKITSNLLTLHHRRHVKWAEKGAVGQFQSFHMLMLLIYAGLLMREMLGIE